MESNANIAKGLLLHLLICKDWITYCVHQNLLLAWQHRQ